jgi:hypothetical protein
MMTRWRDDMLAHSTIEELLKAALANCSLYGRFGVVLEGSIAEGLGNESSDIDFLVVTAEDEQRPLMPSVMFIHGRRVEVRYRSERALRQSVLSIEGLSAAERSLEIPEDDLDRMQRFARSIALRGAPELAGLHSLLSAAQLQDIVARWFEARARNAARYTVAYLALGSLGDAAGWLASATLMAAKMWGARHGESYLEPKWISRQLERAGAPASLRRRVEAALLPGLQPSAHDIEAGLQLLAELGLTGCENAPRHLSLMRRTEVTTWRFGARVHVVRDARDVFVFDDDTARLWQTLPFGAPLDEAVRVAGTPTRCNRLAQLERLGLVRFCWCDGGRETLRSDEITPPSGGSPVWISLDGARFAGAAESIQLLPSTAQRFGAAGMALVWQHVLVENAREDAIGARASAQWGVLRACIARIVRHAHLALMSGRGVQPLPMVEHALLRARDYPEWRALAELGAEIEATAIDDDAGAERVLARVRDFLDELRRVPGGVEFPPAFETAADWQHVLDIGYDWVRFGAHVDSAFPLEEARDLLSRI